MNFWSTSKVAHAALSTTSSSVTVSQYEIETLLFPNHLYVTALHPYIVKASCEHSSCGRRYAFVAFVMLNVQNQRTKRSGARNALLWG